MEWNGLTITDDMVEDIAADGKLSAALEDSCKDDPALWIADHCQIVDKRGQVIQLRFNPTQVHTERVIAYMEGKGLPIRIAHLKARQHGETTRGTARLYHRACTKRNRRCLISAHDDDSSTLIFRDKVQFFHENNPAPRPHKYSTRKEIIFSAPHNSALLVATAGKESLGRGSTLDDVHASEVAFWPNPDKTMLSLNQCLPSEPGTMMVQESTANGMGGFFWRTYRYARKAPFDMVLPYMVVPEPTDEEWNGYYRVFNPWFVAAEYRTEPPADFGRTVDERELAGKYGLDDAQLYWRRRTILEKCNGELDLFKQEYPSDDRECFLLSGRPCFDAGGLEFLTNLIQPPHWTGDMGWRKVEDEDGHKEEIVDFFDDRGPGWVEIWEKPVSGVVYAIGADTAEGLDPTETNDPDAHSGHVIRVDTNRVVAKISGRFDPDLFGEQLDFLGRYYNCALLGVEVNNTSGGSVRSTLKRLDYPNLFYRERIDRTTDEPTLVIGWETNRVTRGTLVMDLKEAVRSKWIGSYSAQTVHQLASFVYGKDGKPQATTGEHDDDVISLGITYQMAAQAALDGAYDIADTAGVPANERADGQIDTSMLIGGRELEPEKEDDDEYY